jgi:REP element-mobilizing transposase RayT
MGSTRARLSTSRPSKEIREASSRMAADARRLDQLQRQLVEQTIVAHCQIRVWTLHAVNCRSNHVHIVVSADRHPDDVRDQFKAWCARRLNELERTRYPGATQQRWRWFAERGSGKYVNSEDELETVNHYVRDAQD